MKISDSKEMRAIDRRAIEEYGIPGSVLMERAGVSVAGKIIELFPPKKVLILAGSGNNGGDGIVAGRELFNAGWSVKILLLLREDRLSPDCLSQLRIARRLGVPMEFRSNIEKKDTNGAIIVDSILGTGLSKPVEGDMAGVIAYLNSIDNPVVSVDMPSGVSSDTGEVMGIAVKAAYTITFGLPKRGHFLYPGAEYIGELFVKDIGFPEELIAKSGIKCNLIGKADVRLPKRPRHSHKGAYGHVLLVAGSRGKTGAALLSARACLRTGAGLVTIASPDSIADALQPRVTEEMTLPLSEGKNKGTLGKSAIKEIIGFLNQKAGILAIGPGLGDDPETKAVIRSVIAECPKPMVIDADGINAIDMELLKAVKQPFAITPHPGELSRLSGAEVKKIESARLQTAGGFFTGFPERAEEDGGFLSRSLVLKGVPTVIADGSGEMHVNTTGNPGMAKAGSGDVLTGMIAAFMAQGLNPLSASVSGVFLHGRAGDAAVGLKGLWSALASDIIEAIPEAVLSLGLPEASERRGFSGPFQMELFSEAQNPDKEKRPA